MDMFFRKTTHFRGLQCTSLRTGKGEVTANQLILFNVFIIQNIALNPQEYSGQN